MAHRTSPFSRFAKSASRITGQAYVFIAAVAVIVVWALTGPIFAFSDTWQLIINTGTTIVTFLMVFLIQNTQNRDTAAIQLKLDMEELDEDELEGIRSDYEKLAEDARSGRRGSGEARAPRSATGRGRSSS
jgi:low affinity Fe/Cu permease